jgi:hypothetical protein
MARYLKVLWHHDCADDPVMIYSEIDDFGYEMRKIEVYRDGRYDFADEDCSSGVTILGEKPLPDIEEISKQAEFSPASVDAQEFEDAWQRAIQGNECNNIEPTEQ